MSAPVPVELAGVDVAHPSAPATVLLEGVDWRIAAGELHVVAGEQGSGRTALLVTAAGLGRPAAGTVRLFGHDLATASDSLQAEWRRRIGFVFEHGGRLLSHLTVAENVALPLQYHLGLDAAEARGEAARLLAANGLGAVADAMPSRLSVRLQQRASLVRALALPKEVLFLDNPLSGTTARGGEWWLDVLRRLRADPTATGVPLTVVASCDDFAPWLDVATHFALIEGRRLRLLGGRAALVGSGEVAVRDFLSALRWASRT
jgi:ABC-type transporter Mla maintaining outer membrane lipid asymmetry ATPase subunit MlaF